MYSVRMRAEKGGRHISGAERLVSEEEIQDSVQSLTGRALSHERGKPDFVNISVEAVKSPVKNLASLPVILHNAGNVMEGRNAARRTLEFLGIPGFCIQKALSLLENGPSDGQSMRGAIIMDMQGNRLEPDRERGVRATRMDITEKAAGELTKSLSGKGLSSYFTHVKEALVLATKVASIDGTVAELCWSDDPYYTAGYVASGRTGYIRIPYLKENGDSHGGRVFFVDNINIPGYINEIENKPVLIDRFAGIREFTDFHTI
ncbi:MAG: 6-carboxyhexanoate--CoA ligase [Candidatus Methanoperedens sp.]|nr:6-carboxyhexanoate--CoA ligase [Candidatus Methanoperedens sp.]